MTPAARVPDIADVDPTQSTFRGPEVCALTGITYRQLDYWARTGLVRPSIADAQGSGTSRLYSAADVVLAGVIQRLLGGTSPNHAHNDRLVVARRCAPIIRAAIDDGAGAVLVITSDGAVSLVDDAEHLYALVQLHQAVRVITVPALERDAAPVQHDQGDANTNAAVTSCVAAGL